MDAALIDPERWLAWDRHVAASACGGFMQSSWWARFREPLGFDHFAVTIKCDGAIVGGALVARWEFAPGRAFYYLQGGPLLPERDEAFAQQVFEAILQRIDAHRRTDDHRISHLRIEPRWLTRPAFVQGFAAPAFGDRFREPRRTLCLDLRLPDEALLAQMKPKGRYNIRVAQRHGVQVVQDNSVQGLADFVRIVQRTARRQGIETKPASYFRAMLACAAPPLSLLFAEYRGRRLAAALVLRFGARATYFYGGSLVLQRRVMAPYLLQFEAALRARADGCEWYDLWGVAPADSIGHRWQAISEFKRKFGGVEFDFGPTLDRVFDRTGYALFGALQQPKRQPAPRPVVAPPQAAAQTA
jgi:peptidoglycan pentaglycine glycine transferase (the first glycine)